MQVYSEQEYIIFQRGKGYIVYNTKKKFQGGHSHLRSFKAAKDAILFAKKKKIPKTTGFYYLQSLQRISADQEYVENIEGLIQARKQKGKKQQYTNKPGFYRRA